MNATTTSGSIPTSLDAKTNMPIVYIHGIGPKPPAGELKLQWDLALFGRDMGDRTRMAYWADLLHGPTPIARSGPHAQATRDDDPDSIDIEALLASVGLDPEGEREQVFADGLLRAAGALPAERMRRALPLPKALRKPIARFFMESFVKDSAAYFFKPAVRAALRARLRAQMPADEPFVLVAHSLGSVVALETLADMDRTHAPCDVGLFVTIGSPLGIRELQDELDCDLTVPDNIGRWYNFADIIDPVALDKGIASDFHAKGKIFDELIVNAELQRLQSFNPHSAAGYLSHPKVRRLVQLTVGFDMHARFLVARDVSEQMGVPDRQHVLIEILEPGYPALDEQDTVAVESREDGTDLGARIARATARIADIVRESADAAEPESAEQLLEDARIDPLRRFVSARLTPAELTRVAQRYRDLRVYAIWKSTRKRKLSRPSYCAVQADAAWASYRAHGERITWAVLDTGVRADHPHFSAHRNIVDVWDCTRPGRPRRIERARDRDGHGSHVCGIIAGHAPVPPGAAHEGGAGAASGVAPNARLVVYKVLDDRGEGEDAWIIKALDHIAERNESSADLAIDGLNLSLGGPYDSTVYGCGFSPLCVELRRQWRAGVLVVVAAGNEGQLEVTTPDGEVDINTALSIGDPANLDECIAVGSVNGDKPHLYGVSAFSSRGPTVDGRLKPDVVAPGERILSCDAQYRSRDPRDLYRYESGTSMAAPHVSGLLAAFLSVRREYRGRPDEVKALLLRTCIDLGRDRYHQGHGLPNLMKMLLET